MTARLHSPLARFAAFAMLAIVLPAAILAVLGYLSLRQWQSSAALLFREQSREMAAMAAEKVKVVLLQTEDEIIGRIRPLVERLYLFDRQGRLLFPATWTPRDAEARAAIPAELSDGFWERGGRRHLAVGGQAIVTAVLKASNGAPVLAALSRNPEVLRRDIFAKTLGSLEGPSIMAVLDPDEHPVYSRAPLDRADRVATVSFGDELPSWRLALYQPVGMSPR